MARRRIAAAIATLWVACSAAAAETERTTGPGGLAGWKLTHTLENQNEVSETLIIARNGRVIRRIHGDPFVWRWMFRDDGKSVALESGPLHFGMACVLISIATGKELQRVDCYPYPGKPPPGGWPEWVSKLEDSD